MATKRGMNERIQKLKVDLSVNTPVHIDLERAKNVQRPDFSQRKRG